MDRKPSRQRLSENRPADSVRETRTEVSGGPFSLGPPNFQEKSRRPTRAVDLHMVHVRNHTRSRSRRRLHLCIVVRSISGPTQPCTCKEGAHIFYCPYS